MNPYNMGYENMRRNYSLRTFSEYRSDEALYKSRASVSSEGTLLEYETLELRLHPPNIVVDNELHDTDTVITIDSANRPGTLVEVVQYLTEMGLVISSARISSDGGWFVDVFHVTDGGSKVLDPVKLQKLKQMLSLENDVPEGTPAEGREAADSDWTTVFELVGKDQAGLLADVTQLLTCNGCDVRSAAVWTYKGQAAFVLSVMEAGQAMKNSTKLTRLHELLTKMMGDSPHRAVVSVKNVKGNIHHERRLHQRMLEEDLFEWERARGQKMLNTASSLSAAPPHVTSTGGLGASNIGFASEMLSGKRTASDTSEASAESTSTNILQPTSHGGSPMDMYVESLVHSRSQPVAIQGGQQVTQTSNLADMSSDPETFRSAKYSRPDIQITHEQQKGYWEVIIKCKDRKKLFFDTVCTLADMQFDVYHAAIDSEGTAAYQEYYICPTHGDSDWDETQASRLRAILEVAVQRRFPPGLKVHVHSVDRFGLLASLCRVLYESNLTIRRAVVKTRSVNNSSGHTFYVMDVAGGPPNREKVEEACHKIGGKLVQAGDENSEQIKIGSGGHKFSFSFLNRQWHKEWTGSLGSTGSLCGSPSEGGLTWRG